LKVANLEGASFNGAKLAGANLDRATTDGTNLPPEMKAASNG